MNPDTLYHYIYKITNNITGKIYIGKRYGKLTEPYFGSGKWIKRSIQKHGIENFSKQILLICREENWCEIEKRAIKLYEAQHPKIGYNFADGGEGGDTYKGRSWKQVSSSEVYQERLNKKAQRDKLFWTKEQKAKLSETVKIKQWSGTNGQIRKQTLSKKVSGSNNPSAKQYKIITPVETFMVKGLKSWCREQNLVFDTVRKFINKGPIQRTSIKDTSWFWSDTKKRITGWIIEEIENVED